MNRAQQYYKLNRIFKASYHARIRAGEDAAIYETYRAMNERIVAGCLLQTPGRLRGAACKGPGA